VRHHQKLNTKGSVLHKEIAIDRVSDLSFADSRADERLQLADLISYTVYRQFVDDPASLMAPNVKPTYDYLARIEKKFCCKSDGAIAGHGIAIFPRPDAKAP
jgi:hypothetical protein